MTNRFKFQGMKQSAPYFEGWYVKSTDAKQDFTLALIPGIAKFSSDECFVQYNLFYKGKTLSGKITFPIDSFDVVDEPYSILMPKFVLSEAGLRAHLTDEELDLLVDLNFGAFLPLNQDIYSPSIMGPLEYIKMPCSHDIVSMKHTVAGTVIVNGEKISIEQGIGYIEKDRGSTFPSKYVWSHANDFKENDESSLFLSVAEINFNVINLTGSIAVFHDGMEEHRFATYLGSKLEISVDEDNLGYTVKFTNRKKMLLVTVSLDNATELIAPMDKKMDYVIKETVKATITLTFKEKNKDAVYLTSENGAAENVNWI